MVAKKLGKAVKKRTQTGLYIPVVQKEAMKKYCKINQITIPDLIERLVADWYTQCLATDPAYFTNLKKDEYRYVDFVNSELEKRVNNEKYIQLWIINI